MNEYIKGLRNGVAIGLAYFAVSFAFGVSAVTTGLSPITATIISLTNLTSSGQVAGVKLIEASASYFELALTVFLINVRYILMSLSFSQQIDPNLSFGKRMIMAFGITDEIYAFTTTRKEKIEFKYMLGIMTLPVVCWSLGTLLGSIGATFIPADLLTAFNIAIYAMFIGIIMPKMKKEKSVLLVVFIAIAISIVFEYDVHLNGISLGFKMIIATVVAALIGALICPRRKYSEIEEEKCHTL